MNSLQPFNCEGRSCPDGMYLVNGQCLGFVLVNEPTNPHPDDNCRVKSALKEFIAYRWTTEDMPGNWRILTAFLTELGLRDQLIITAMENLPAIQG